MTMIPYIDMIKTGENITALRCKAGLTVKDLQKIYGFATPQAIYKWQKGIALPTVDNLVVLAAAFHVTIDEILVVSEAPPRNKYIEEIVTPP
ncbi:MAG: helix-turn-helix domain-containing protein [Roseburia sp.]|nr:helix-turn-helix domain-containing protein [Roseburia sp.]